MRTRLAAVTLAFLILMMMPVASVPAAVADKESGSYDIEVLVFENRLPGLAGDELLERDATAKQLRALEKAETVYALLGESFFQPALAKLLEQDGHYRVLAHHHWTQTFEPDAKAAATKPVRIVSATNPAELDGAIRFSLSRYLHLDVNLVYQAPGADKTAAATYRISEQRRIKSQEVHYFDHPKFGVLVRVMPLEKLP
jgi:hypothetical protein